MGGPAKLHSDLQGLVGTLIHDRYRVESLLGVGGMGAVFRGHHLGLRRDVAIKVLHPEIGRDESISKRFDREATSASRLDHPNCVRVTDFGTIENGTKYLAMEFLEGRELKDSLGKALPPARAVQIAIQIFQALEHAHHFGVVHRDLKPENVYVTTDFRGQEIVKLVDFGIAKLIDEQGAQEKLTRAGLVFGTPRYMSPEQAAGGKIDERTDLYAAGLILYEMLCGHPPFDADDPAQLLRMQILAPPPALPPSVPQSLAKVVEKLLEKSKSDRLASAREALDLLVALERELASLPAAPAPVAVVPVVANTNGAATGMQRSLSSWQPAVPTSSIPAPPPPAPGVSGMHLGVPPPPPPPPGASAMHVVAPVVPMAPTLPEMPASHSTSAPTIPEATSSHSFAGQPTPSVIAPTYPSIPVAVTPTPRQDTRKAWLPWAVVAGSVFVALMAFGALISSREEAGEGNVTPGSGAEAAPGSEQDQSQDRNEKLREEQKKREEREREARKKREEKDREARKKREEEEREEERWEIKFR